MILAKRFGERPLCDRIWERLAYRGAAVACVLSVLTGPCLALPQYWEGGDFSEPKPKPNSLVLMDVGERYSSWRVVGESGNVAWTSGGYVHRGFNFVAQNPATRTKDAWVNLAGISQSKTGIVHHPVPTLVGNTYTLSFYVGNIYDPGGAYGTSSTIAVYENSRLLGTYTNSSGQGSKDETWQSFSVTFKADAPYTSIAFVNGDPPGDRNCGIDNTVFGPASQADGKRNAR